jgi:hypothetical protein
MMSASVARQAGRKAPLPSTAALVSCHAYSTLGFALVPLRRTVYERNGRWECRVYVDI